MYITLKYVMYDIKYIMYDIYDKYVIINNSLIKC